MFYSHTFLAKKGPLGTVWIAAHLQHKLRKSHVAVTDISSTVDCIMFPEVPIALRLSGHLLLGVVRIYSKKVDYLYHDCNDILSQMRTMFASVHVNLPEDADRATFQAVTLPDTFQLDALELDTLYLDESPDKHRKDLEQITLPDQIPVEGEYVAILVNEDRFDSSPHVELPNLSAGAGPINKELLPPCGEVNTHYVGPLRGSSVESLHRSANAEQTTPLEGCPVASFHPNAIAHPTTPLGGSSVGHPSADVARCDNAGLDTICQYTVELENDILTPGGSIDKSKHQKGSVSPAILPSTSGEKPPENSTAMASIHAFPGQNSGASTGVQSFRMELPPSPPVQRQNAERRRRKRFFDESIVLSNAEMRRRLEDTSKLVRKRKNNPSTTLDVWKFQKHMKKDQMFNEPLLYGMCKKLQDVYERAFPIVMDVSSPNTIHEMDVEMDQAGHSGMKQQDLLEADIETEQARFHVGHDQDQPEPMHSTFERELSPVDSTTFINASLSKGTRTPELEMPSRLEVPASAEHLDDLTATPSGVLEEPLTSEMGLSVEVPCLLNSPEEDLYFLNAENMPLPSPSGHESRGFNSMSSRTRLVAQYYKDQSPMAQLSNDRPGYLSLNKILEGKMRKQCARMFFETLVLKSCDLIDVEQEEAYGDIWVSVTQTPSKLAAI